MPHHATILLIEDDERLGRCLVRMMKAGGYDVVHALTGEAAIENVMKRSFDMILSDLNLPDSCGVDILKIARAYDPDVPLMLMSGSPTIDTTIEAVNLGVLEYLVKPMSPERLHRALRRAALALARVFGRGLPIAKLPPDLAALDALD